ncbi:MAG: hypothetical protein IJ001_10700 [Oscillospiraceae bacterium]|nr:hypothetical protein [Oscillospiraceae bacterium]
MKKLFALLLALTMVFALVACGGNAAKETEAPTEAPTEASTEEIAVPEFHQYTYIEDRGDFEVRWVLTIIGDVYSLDESNGLSGETVTHGIDEVTDNGDGTITTGPWSDADSNKSEFFAPNGICTWVITGEDTFEPVNAGESSGEDEGGIKPGKYAIGDTGWYLMLKGNGQYGLQEGENEALNGASWTDNGDGTVTTSALDDPSAAPEFAGDGSGTWIVNEDGTVTRAE